MTWFYLKTAWRINMMLRPFGLILMAEFEGDPPLRPVTVQRVWIQSRSGMGLWR